MPQGEITLPFSGGSLGLEKTRSVYATILPGDVGPDFTIADASLPIAVFRNGFEDRDYTFNVHTWTFVNPLQEGDLMTFIYNKT